MSRSRLGQRFVPSILAVGLAATLAACGAGTGGASPVATALDWPLISTSASPVSPTDATAGPPAARLAAEGGDPVEGQLGTYTWGDGGSDSPWLSGAPIAVGAGEPLTVTLDGTPSIASWTAIHVPVTADGPAGGVVLGSGTGVPTFAAPGSGSWTVDLEVVFADGLGTAHYAWRLDVE